MHAVLLLFRLQSEMDTRISAFVNINHSTYHSNLCCLSACCYTFINILSELLNTYHSTPPVSTIVFGDGRTTDWVNINCSTTRHSSVVCQRTVGDGHIAWANIKRSTIIIKAALLFVTSNHCMIIPLLLLLRSEHCCSWISCCLSESCLYTAPPSFLYSELTVKFVM